MPPWQAWERSGLWYFSFSSPLIAEELKLLGGGIPLAGAQTGSCHDCGDPAGTDSSDASDSCSHRASTSQWRSHWEEKVRISLSLLKLSLASLVISAGRHQWGGDRHHLPQAEAFLGELPAFLPQSTFLKYYEQGKKCLEAARTQKERQRYPAPSVWLQRLYEKSSKDVL